MRLEKLSMYLDSQDLKMPRNIVKGNKAGHESGRPAFDSLTCLHFDTSSIICARRLDGTSRVMTACRDPI